MAMPRTTPSAVGVDARRILAFLDAAAERDLPVGFYTPSEVKAAVTGSGTAGKAQVTQMVMRILRLDAAPKPADAADALAIAVTHVWRGGATNRYAAAVAAAKGNR